MPACIPKSFYARPAVWTALVLMFAAPLAGAGEGRIEINQARALAGGVSASDAPGFPVTLESAQSYVLTGSLTVPPETHGLEFPSAGDSILVDLNGFSIAGPVVCAGTGPTCTAAGVAYGVLALSNTEVTIRNGTIRGFGTGIRLLSVKNGTLEDLMIASNEGAGIIVNGQATIRDCAVRGNGGNGITGLGLGGNIRGVHVEGNGSIQVDLFGSDSGIVSGSWIDGGAGTALRIDAASAYGYRDSSIQGTIAATTGNLGGNICNGTPTCP